MIETFDDLSDFDSWRKDRPKYDYVFVSYCVVDTDTTVINFAERKTMHPPHVLYPHEITFGQSASDSINPYRRMPADFPTEDDFIDFHMKLGDLAVRLHTEYDMDWNGIQDWLYARKLVDWTVDEIRMLYSMHIDCPHIKVYRMLYRAMVSGQGTRESLESALSGYRK